MSPRIFGAGLPSPIRRKFREIPYLVEAGVLADFLAADDDAVDKRLEPHVRTLEYTYAFAGGGEGLPVVVSSLIGYLRPLTSRACWQMARLYALKATLLLAVGESPEDANTVRHCATTAIDIAHRVESRRGRPCCVAFIAEQHLKSAVALKSLGIESNPDALRYLRQERKALGSIGHTKAGFRLARQEVLIQQEGVLFDRLLEAAVPFRWDRDQRAEYFRTVKRVFEYRLNHYDTRGADALLDAFIEAWCYLPRRFRTVLEEASYHKNLGQYHLLLGNSQQGMIHLKTAMRLATQAQLTGQARQIRALMGAADDVGRLRLPSFELRR